MIDLEVKILEWMKGKIWFCDKSGFVPTYRLCYGSGKFVHRWHSTIYKGLYGQHSFSDEFHNMVSQIMLPYYLEQQTTLDYLNKEFGIEDNH